MSINAVSSHLHRHSWSLLWNLGVLAVVILGFSPRSIAQTDTGRIVGTVTDPGGAAISGAIQRLQYASVHQSGRERPRCEFRENSGDPAVQQSPDSTRGSPDVLSGAPMSISPV